jgi:hypothetical protein
MADGEVLVQGCLVLIAWTFTSLLIAGNLLAYEDAAYGGYPDAPAPTDWPTTAELAAIALWALCWLAGIALWRAAGWLLRCARGATAVGFPVASAIAAGWALIATWATVGIGRMLFPREAAYDAGWPSTWSASGPAELLALLSIWALLWSGGLLAIVGGSRHVYSVMSIETASGAAESATLNGATDRTQV